MTEPFIFVTTHTVKEGRLADLEELNARFVEFVESNEPRILGLHAYLDESATRLAIVQIHPDAESLDAHLEIAADLIHAAFDVVGNDGVQAFGSPGPVARGLLGQIASAGVGVDVMPRSLGGFARFGSGSHHTKVYG